MHRSIEGTLNRADALLADLRAEYENSLQNQNVSDLALQLTHEVCERLRSVLDRTARRYWDKHVSPQIPDADRNAATIYFPIAPNQQGFDSIMGRWRWRAVRGQHQPVYDYLLGLQPFSNADNDWLRILNELAQQGKHIELVPQKRVAQQRITVENKSGARVSWNPANVRFGRGVKIGGAPVNPVTQRIDPTPGVTERVETWVSFTIAEYGVNALGFCQDACRNVRRIAQEMSDAFNLS